MSASNPRIGRGRRGRVETRPCTYCGYKFDKELCQCPDCGQWQDLGTSASGDDGTILLRDVSDKPIEFIRGGVWRLAFSDTPGGIPTIATILLGGGPGAGKSTIALQISDHVAGITGRETLYVAAEEAEAQIKNTAKRLKLKHADDKVRIRPMGCGTDIGNILLHRKPALVVIDSLGKLVPDPDMCVEMCKRLKDYAIELKCPALVIDHVTKDGDYAGVMKLQHEVDTTMIFHCPYGKEDPRRELITDKNRFGPPGVMPLLMTAEGLTEGEEDEDE